MSSRKLLTIGVTGSMGSGKSAVCKHLSTSGYEVFAADEEAKRLMEHDESVKTKIIEQFGQVSYLSDGTLDTKYLAEVVFSDAHTLKQINNIVHPPVFVSFQKATEKASIAGKELIIMEAALIYEVGYESHLDIVLAVDAPAEERIIRVARRDNITREAILNRMQHQMPSGELVRKADYVIYNDGTLEDLWQKTDAVWNQIRAEHRVV
ncbi:MAG: dephospho-CoA kinase [Fibrobacteria bacterium]|nr:dephospho-CoA kinase [Fibrobacteria bacterium]